MMNARIDLKLVKDISKPDLLEKIFYIYTYARLYEEVNALSIHLDASKPIENARIELILPTYIEDWL